MAKIYYQEMTTAGHRVIEEQIEALKQKRPTLIARLKAARALGDLSETPSTQRPNGSCAT